MHLASSNSLSASLSPSPSHERPLVFPTGYTLVSVFGILSVHGQDLETSQIPAVPLPNFDCIALCEQDTLCLLLSKEAGLTAAQVSSSVLECPALSACKDAADRSNGSATLQDFALSLSPRQLFGFRAMSSALWLRLRFYQR